MCALDARPDAVQIGRVRVRGPADALRARRRLEASVANLSPAALGLPPRAVLVVRRVAPSARLPLGTAARTDGFSRAVRDALRMQAASARRPWLHADAAAEAVWFADEAELAACLVRDWLRGAISERWWWRGVLAGTSAEIWLRAHVLARGEVLVPVLALLAERGDAVAWAARLSAPEAEWAADAVVRAYALASPDEVHEPAPGPRVSPRAQPGAGAVALTRVLAAVPEARASTLAASQRRMLAVALAVAREPAWARTAEFATALRMLDAATPLELAAVSASPKRRAGDAGAVPHPAPVGDDGGRAEGDVDRAPSTSTVSRRGVSRIGTTASARADAADGVGDGEPLDHPPARRSRSRRGDTVRSTGDVGFAAGTIDVSGAEGVIGIPSPATVDAAAVSSPMLPDAADPPSTEVDAAMDPAARWEAPERELGFGMRRGVGTEFGGIFYLLNAALALELYGDFTAPRAKGLALPPWDLLAMVGRAWFGAEFIGDAVWPALASLAGRAADEPPGTYFHAPREWRMPDAWLAPWGEIGEVPVHATRTRLRILHPAGFAVCDVARDPALRPLAQARALAAAYPQLRGATLRRVRSIRIRRSTRAANERWLGWLLDFLVARLALALDVDKAAKIPVLLCRHPARVAVSASAVDVHLSLADLPLPVRIAGLDRDAGWIPAAGRSLSFHFS